MAVNQSQDRLARDRRRKRRQQQIMRRRMVFVVSVLAIIVLILVLVLATGNGGKKSTNNNNASGGTTSTVALAAATYRAQLNGENSVPSVDTSSTGELTMTYDPDKSELSYELLIHGLSSPTTAAIYEGIAGTGGTAVYVLYAGTDTMTAFEGSLAEGIIDPSRFTGSLMDGTVADLIDLIESGNAYVSVGNASHAIDAIRGPITSGSIGASSTSTSTTDTTDSTD